MGRPKRPIESLMVDMPLKVLPETAQEIESLAERLERSKSFINRKLVLRGLAAYYRDGNLDEPAYPEPRVVSPPLTDGEPIPIEKRDPHIKILTKKGGHKSPSR